MLYIASWAGLAVPVWTDDEGLLRRAGQFLGLEMRPASKGETAALKIHRVARGWEFSAPFGPSFLEQEDDAAIFLTMLLAHEFEQQSPFPVLHAGAFDSGRGAVIYLAAMAQGKSSHTFAAWRRGYTILGDDRIALRLEDGAAQAIPKCVKLRIDQSHVPNAWRAGVPAGETMIGGYADDRRWVLSRGLPGMAPCDALIPIRAITLLRRIDEGPSHVDETPLSAVIQSSLDYMSLGANTPMDLLRFMKRYAVAGKLPRVNVAPGDIERGVELLAAL